MTVTDQKLFNITLPKYSKIVVVGRPITPEQAKEVLIRTDKLSFSSNNEEFSAQCKAYLYKIKPSYKKKGYYHYCLDLDYFINEDGSINNELETEKWEEILEEIRPLNIHKLNNFRIATCYIGGPYGWCNWDGTIETNGIDIRRATVKGLYEEWQVIAQEFPFLDLTCQVSIDVSEENPNNPCTTYQAVAEFRVKDEQVDIYRPKNLIRPKELEMEDIIISMHNHNRERGCTFEQFKDAVDYVRNKYAQIN